MFIWLPPSESKTTPAHGPRFDVAQLARPELASWRENLIHNVQALSVRDDAAQLFGLGPASAADLQANIDLYSAPCDVAENLFTGVLYDAVSFPTLPEQHHAVALETTRVFSGLFGVVNLDDVLPNHRLAMGTKLPDIGPLPTYWKKPLDASLKAEAEGAPIVDARSGPYRSACLAPWAHRIEIGVVRQANGKRSVISHDAKRWRGRACAHLYASISADADFDAIVEALCSATTLDPIMDAQGGAHAVIDVEVPEAKPTKQGGSLTHLVLVTD